jgi:hypothetical protein
MKTCSWCAGRTYEPTKAGQLIPCSPCRGTGRVEGIDPAVVREAGHLAAHAVAFLVRGILATAIAFALGCPLVASLALGAFALLLSMRS